MLEVLIASALFLLLFVAVADLTRAALDSYQVARSERAVTSSASVALERMSRSIRNASSISGGTYNTAPGDLIINTGSTPATIEFYFSGNQIREKDDGVDIGPLTTSNVVASNLIFRATTTPYSSAVEFSFDLSAGEGSSTIAATFYDTAVLRSGY